MSNYPIKNGRIGNGVGLNTPNSIINILNWFKSKNSINFNLKKSKYPKKFSRNI